MAKHDLQWWRDGKDWVVRAGRSRKALVAVRPDAVYPGMWRIHWPDGVISDMVNLSRAKDAAISGVSTAARKERRVRQRSGGRAAA